MCAYTLRLRLVCCVGDVEAQRHNGNFSDLYIGMWGSLEILVDPYSDFSKGTTAVRALQSIDVAVARTDSFAAIQDIYAT